MLHFLYAETEPFSFHLEANILATLGFLPAILESTDFLQSHNVQRIENRCITILVHDDHGARVQHDKFGMRNHEFVSAGGHKRKRLEPS